MAMTSRDDDWSHITDINERRKAQNRIAQRNYRSRQRMRIELAEAILFDLPHLKSAAAQHRWNETSSNSGSNTRSRTPEFFDTSYQPDSTVDFLDVPGLDDFESPNASAGLDCIDAALNSSIAPAAVNTATQLPAPQPPSQPQPPLPLQVMETSSQPRKSPSEQPLALTTSQPQTHDSPSDAFSCLSDLNDSANSANLSTAASTIDTVSTPSSLKGLTPSSIAKSCSSCSSVASHDPTAECTPLLGAVMRGNLEIARLLIKSGGKVDSKNKSGKTALHLAVERGDTVAARTLLDLGADITLPDDSGTSVFHRAIVRDDIEQLRGLLKWCEEKSRLQPFEGLLKRCVNLKDTQKRTLVHLAVVLERIEILKLLLEYGADVNE
ncbi:ankyrin repeat protein [Colletotrichum asianum]|uniref:protein S-acyltransferase n=1 Tax=Colletotrichum asianum TaxID=702518 RepID=A0A8H3ZJD1_9PEZI|nr:ankyrin repeat protein [Colletotrichum asianum]